ncbi:MAG: tetratricopeptide repeat protein [Caldilineaceae bacterium]
MLIWQSVFQRHLRKLDNAHRTLQHAENLLAGHLLADLDTRAEHALLLLERAELIYSRNYKEAKPAVEQSLASYHNLHDSWRFAQGLSLFGEVIRYLGGLEESRQLQEQALDLRQHLGDRIGIAHSLKNLAGLARHAGEFAEAAALLRQCIIIFNECDDQAQRARCINDLAVTLVHDGKFADSLALFEKGLEIHHTLGLPGEPGAPTMVKGFALMHMGQYERAKFYLKQVLSFYPKWEIGYAVKNLARIALAQNVDSDAGKQLWESLELFRRLGDVNGSGQALSCLGYLALRQQNVPQAQTYIYESLQLAAETHVFLPSMTALAGLALLRSVTGDGAGAIELYTVALQHRHVANSRWYYDVVGRQIDEAAAKLPADTIEAAQDRGRSQEWRAVLQQLLADWEEILRK